MTLLLFVSATARLILLNIALMVLMRRIATSFPIHFACRLRHSLVNRHESGHCSNDASRAQNSSVQCEWIGNFCLGYFKRSGAKKDFVKHLKVEYERQHNHELPKEDYYAILKSLNSDVISNSNMENSVIKLLEVVGSSPSIRGYVDDRHFDITTVRWDDFPKPVDGNELAQPYDVVTLSSVLSSVDTPEQRAHLIHHARNVLVPAGFGGRPHRAGLLIIIERDEIFKHHVASKGCVETNLHQLAEWRHAIRGCGLALVKYRTLEVYGNESVAHATASSSSSNGLGGTEVIGEGQGGVGGAKAPPLPSSKMHVFTYRTSNEDSTSAIVSRLNATHSSWTAGSAPVAVAAEMISLSRMEHSPLPAAPIPRGDGDGLFEQPKLWIPQDFIINGSNESHEKAMMGEDVGVTIGSDGSQTHAVATINASTPVNEIDETHSLTPHVPVAIIGGGIGGVALALSLLRRGLGVRVFEKDLSLGARRQGYALTMQQGKSPSISPFACVCIHTVLMDRL